MVCRESFGSIFRPSAARTTHDTLGGRLIPEIVLDGKCETRRVVTLSDEEFQREMTIEAALTDYLPINKVAYPHISGRLVQFIDAHSLLEHSPWLPTTDIDERSLALSLRPFPSLPTRLSLIRQASIAGRMVAVSIPLTATRHWWVHFS